MSFITDIVRAEQLATQSLRYMGQGHGGHGTENGTGALPPVPRMAAAAAATSEARTLIERHFDTAALAPADAFLLRNAHEALGRALPAMDPTVPELLMPAMNAVEGAIAALDQAHRRAGVAEH